MSRVAAAFWNPIVAKEYRSRMRTWRSPLALMVYILLLGGLQSGASIARRRDRITGSREHRLDDPAHGRLSTWPTSGRSTMYIAAT